MALYGGPPKECPFCKGKVDTATFFYAGMTHRFRCQTNPTEHHGFYSNNKDEREPLIAYEHLSYLEMQRLINFALMWHEHFGSIDPNDNKLITKVRKWKQLGH